MNLRRLFRRHQHQWIIVLGEDMQAVFRECLVCIKQADPEMTEGRHSPNWWAIPKRACPECGGPIANVEFEWGMGLYGWACWSCRWVEKT